jgi:CheY-like chemotaxis protein
MKPFATRRVSIAVTEDMSVVNSAVPLRRVLFVSADADLREVVDRVLTPQGYQVHTVAHSGHALLLCRTTHFNVLVAELTGPDMSGPALAGQLRRHCPGLSVIYLGSPGTPEGVERVLVRPFTRDDLLESLQFAFHAVAA